MRYVAKLNINGTLREITSKNMPEWMAKKHILSIIKELSRVGKQVKLISFSPKEVYKHSEQF